LAIRWVLRRSIVPSGPTMIAKTHLQPIMDFLDGNGTSSQVPLFYRALISSSIVINIVEISIRVNGIYPLDINGHFFQFEIKTVLSFSPKTILSNLMCSYLVLSINLLLMWFYIDFCFWLFCFKFKKLYWYHYIYMCHMCLVVALLYSFHLHIKLSYFLLFTFFFLKFRRK